jgi:predicted enzyme related to lactoylglutathione lyase
MITGTDFICVPVDDFDAGVAFYGDVLGLTRSKQWGQMPGMEFETGNLTLAVMEPTAFGQEFHTHSMPIEFRVDDVAVARSELESRGVTFEGETIDSGVCHQAFFKDPAGNSLAIHHRYAPH